MIVKRNLVVGAIVLLVWDIGLTGYGIWRKHWYSPPCPASMSDTVSELIVRHGMTVMKWPSGWHVSAYYEGSVTSGHSVALEAKADTLGAAVLKVEQKINALKSLEGDERSR